ncbi:MAG: D-alanyl-D-alanine carboxypeptidase [Coriobacteriales bacterium]|jgi:D-alanyl-D-alanine carboxypeptidase (penicillin-binding protein 5/6)|nr:D-alanyl-D-alanine carboxypeptidase [Coriobacteriales bacterium]
MRSTRLYPASAARTYLARPVRLLLAAALALLLASAGLVAGPQEARADVRTGDRVANRPLGDGHPLVPDAPDLVADHAALCTKEGTILWERDAQTPVPMASTTKVMTAVVALENAGPDTPMLVTWGAANTDGSGAGLTEGDTASLRDLVVCMMVPSGNDAAVAIAENVAGTEFAFVDMMNERAAALGMTGTHFSNASGLYDENNYTTAADYLLLTRVAMGNELFREVVGATEVSATVSGQLETYTSTNLLLEQMEGANGVKTGFTDEAGYCLVASAQQGGLELYAVVLHSSSEEQRATDAQALLEWGFVHYRTVELINATVPVADLALLSWVDKTVPVAAASPVSVRLFDYAGEIQQEVVLTEEEGRVEQGQAVGSLTWSQNGEVLAQVDLLALQDVPAPGFWEGIGIWWQRLVGGLFGDPPHATSTTALPTVFDLPVASAAP